VKNLMQISAKKLGWLAMPSFCPRCFWIRTHMNGEPPFSVFPKIFNEIDRFEKRVVHGWFDEGTVPPWLTDLGVIGYINPPHSSKFRMPLGDDVLLTGEADAIFKRQDGFLTIADYKTAYCAGTDDPLYPVYEVQLNAYALLAEHLGLGKVSHLALIYAEPCTSDLTARAESTRRKDGFCLPFRTRILEIPLNTDLVPALAIAAREIFDITTCPPCKDGCRDCEQSTEMFATTGRVFTSKEVYAQMFA
jgi:hypothetical protein